eukprot:CAMPEP_0202688616 /NCGR_PEP_ID=MMETSP1385-20130828/4108_1 /ASSEMBLY_ACC=CAM_ASM_000861 /TAXON_ID=933848 /ORGANISM="Elphidium margaritaceum" /LENGTH=1276 /DNA_ID=CAMNT_0049343631 /DNA_START=189 /DNA_END=4019 /DNA_ORIENTATION=-
MSGSALDQVKSLMAMIDEFDVTIATAPAANNALPSQSQQQQGIPSVLQSNLPIDAAFRPSLPSGHTAYSWFYTNTYVAPKPSSSAVAKSSAVKSSENAASKGGNNKSKQNVRATSKGGNNKDKPVGDKSNKSKSKNKNKPKIGKLSSKGNDDADDSKQNFERRDRLISLQREVQQEWDAAKVFEANAQENKPKYFCTFPYPYMNGYLHLGHAFTITKAEFRAGYERLRGKNVLWPFAFHCTGMPIAAAAKRISEEMQKFGNPPTFPRHDDRDETDAAAKAHSKLAAKRSKKKYQWEIMTEFELGDADIAKFKDPYEWLSHFPPIGKQHLKEFGLKVDWRRSFITTDANPYYNKFIEWQFLKLRDAHKIEFGNRPTIFSPAENQPCADHDRSSGETMKPQQYTLIKLELLHSSRDLESVPFIQRNGDKLGALYALNKKIYLVAATLRPETMYGQTNCFVLPRGEYIAIEVDKDERSEIYVCSEHAARNMAWQEFTRTLGEYKVLCRLEGWDLLGRPLKAPNAVYDRVYVLPLTTIKMDKGSGIVTSVPSDAPSDYAALKDAKNDKNFRDKYYLTDAMVLPYEVVKIIRIAEFNSEQSAVDLCEKHKIKSQQDTNKLEEIKLLVYKYGFSQGVMLVGDFAGEKVSVAKEKCQRQLVRQGLADVYWEPEETVMSRTGYKCVVAYCDQWFLKYGIQNPDEADSKENEWQRAVKQHIANGLECYNAQSKDSFMATIDWLHSWACSREFGLGTKLPWDKSWVIESLSDSTIYMAYYTIAPFLQNGSMDGDASSNSVKADDLTPQVFDAVFCGADVDALDLSKSTLSKDLILNMRREFEYWYPMDLRVSGKDLIFNHLTMSLYNHAAIWPQQSAERWPQSYFTNGWALMDGDKMSKSEGNFLTIQDAVRVYGADATRFALANAGDTLEDANFETDVANAAILGLTRFEKLVEETYALLKTDTANYRDGDFNEMDKLFDNALNRAINETASAFECMRFRDVLRFGYHILRRNADYYMAHVNNGVHRELIQRYIDVQLVLLSPVCPHTTEAIWGQIHGQLNGFCVNAKWPQSQAEDLIRTLQFESLQQISHQFRDAYKNEERDRNRKLNKAKKGSETHAKLQNKHNAAMVCVADDYKPEQKEVLRMLARIYDADKNALTVEKYKEYILENSSFGAAKQDSQKVNTGGGGGKKKKQKLSKEQQAQLQFAAYMVNEIMPDRKKETFNERLAYDEFDFLSKNKELVFHGVNVDLKKVTFYKESDNNAPELLRQRTKVGDPTVKFFYVE